LRPSDFKLNPNINHGLDYAFVEPIRGRAARRCLVGCTDPNCCGDAIRTLAADLRPTLPRPIFPDSPEDQELDDDDYLIKKHMGDRWDRQAVANLSTEDRELLLLEARTKIIAQRHGRHRFTDGRRKTPPGYWNADMQSTPELEEDRRKGELMEREMVMERYHEAMRGGGRWLFRDE
jgi:hypothetical protein